MKTPEIRLSQCMIVKNEEKYMEQALSWGKDIMYEQIVVDTGSTDRTVELAEKMGAEVYHFEWIDDFSAAKNFALKKATGNWIAFLDADEHFSQEDAEKIIPILQQVHPDYSIDAIRCQCVHLGEDGSIIGTSVLDRLFRNDPKIRYQNRIHEALARKGKHGLRSKDMQSELAVLHAYGDGGEARQREKGARNARLLEKELKENPKDALRLMYLGDAFSMAQEERKALDTYRRVLNDETLDVVHDVVIQRAGFEVMYRLLAEASEENRAEFFEAEERLRRFGGEEHPDIDYLPGCWYVKRGDHAKAAACFERAIGKLETYRGMETVRLNTNLPLVCCIIAKAALEKGDLQKAVNYAVITLQAGKYHADAISILLKSFFAEWKADAPVEPYVDFLKQLYDLEKKEEAAFLKNAARDAGFEKLAEAIG